MRTVSGSILTAQQLAVAAPRHAAVAWPEVLSFASFASYTTSGLETEVPATFAMRRTESESSGDLAYASFRFGYRSLVKVIDTTAAADWALTDTSATALFGTNAVRTMRACVFTDAGGDSWVYTADASGSAIQIKRAQLTGTTNPLTISLSNYGGTFGEALTDTSTLVRRIEAVCPTDGGVIVAVGTHRFDIDLSTLEFFWYPGAGSVIQLNTLIQFPLAGDYADYDSEWWSFAKYATFVHAIYNSTTQAICVYANDQTRGRSVMFTVKNGVESALRPVVPIEAEATALSFLASSVSKIGSLYYLAGHWQRANYQDGVAAQTTAFDCYLTSTDGEWWSFGERSFYLQSSQGNGALLMKPYDPDLPAPAYVYYGGNGLARRAPVTRAQYASAAATTLDDLIGAWSVDSVVDGADALSLTLVNSQLAGGSGALDDHAQVKRGAVVKLQTGFLTAGGAVLADFGIYSIDEIAGLVDETGVADVAVRGRDYGSKRIIDTNMLVEVALNSRRVLEDALTNLDSWTVKTEAPDERGITTDSVNHLKCAGLNDPFIAYANVPAGDANSGADGLFKATIKFTVDDDTHLSSVGFLFGAGDDGTGLLVMIPKPNAWTGHTQAKARVRRLSLPAVVEAEPDKEDTGFNLAKRVNNLWEAAGGTARTSAMTGLTYRTDADVPVTYTPGDEVDVAVRMAGRRLQVLWKVRDYSPSVCADAAGYILLSDTLFGTQEKRSQFDANQVGLALCTDVFVDKDAFSHAVYDDVETALTEAVSNYGLSASYQTAFSGTATVSNVAASNQITLGGSYDISEFHAGQAIRVAMNFSGHGDRFGIVQAATGNLVTTVDDIVTGANQGSDSGTARVYLASAEEYGYAASGARERTINGETVVDNPQSIKTELALYGAGIIVNNDNTALTYRHWLSDGTIHYLLSGAYDATWPGDTSSTDPSVWRFVYAHNCLALYWVSTEHGLPTSGHMLVDDEVVKYEEISFTQFRQNKGSSYTNASHWTVIPTHYTVVAQQASASDTFVNAWLSGHAVGEGFDSSDIELGMLVELLSRDAGTDDGQALDTYKPAGWHIQSKTGSGETAAIRVGRYDKPFGTLSYYTPGVRAAANDIIVSSFRGRFGTAKVGHDEKAPVVYYPCDTDGAPASILVSHFGYYSGLYQSAEDAVKRMATLAGMRDWRFRNAFTVPAADDAFTIGTTAHELPLTSDRVDFVLEGTVHLPGNSTDAGGAVTGEKRLNIYARDYYRLTLQQYTTAADYQAGHAGNVRLSLSTTSTDIDAPTGGDYRWLERTPAIPITDYNLSGSVSGAHPQYTLTEDAARNIHLRVVVRANLVAVEIGGQPIWTFNLDRYTDGVHSYRKDTPGPVSVEYSSAIAGNTATLRVPELGEEVAQQVARRETSAAAAISEVCLNRHVKSRATAAGGLEWSRFDVRDDAGAFTENLFSDKWTRSDMIPAGHVLVAGRGETETSGEAIDEARIISDGYRFEASSNEVVGTAEEAREEAALLLREALEMAEEREIEGAGFVHVQPEDAITLAYAPAGDAPQGPAEEDWVVSAVRFQASLAALLASYRLRRYVA